MNNIQPNQYKELTDRFARLFRGRIDAWGAVHGESVKQSVVQKNYFLHLIGNTSLGIYPLMDDNTCRFAAIDIDQDDLNLALLIREELWNIGLKNVFVERSKSKGYHLWIFFSDSIKAVEIRAILKYALDKLEIQAEIFPKQDFLRKDEIGSYINLPYFGALKDTSENRVIINTKTLQSISLIEFLNDAERLLVTPDVIEIILDELPSIPEHASNVIEKPKEIQDVDIANLNLSDKIKKLILGEFERGNHESLVVADPKSSISTTYPSRSEADEAIIASLLGKGCAEDVVFGVFEKYPTTGKYKEKGRRKEQYLIKSIENAKRFIGAKSEESDIPSHKLNTNIANKLKFTGIPVPSTVLSDGRILEMVYDPKKRETQFAVFNDGELSYEKSVNIGDTYSLVPYSPRNNLLKNEVILFPSEAQDYESEEELLYEIKEFIHTYVDIPPLFENISSYYVLFSWIYDDFRELPYLRVIGDTGSGKTRFLLTVGSLCYKPIFASGASTVSPLFRILDIFRGTLIIDEGDFRQSDEKAEIIKVLNNGNAKGFPVLRSEQSQGRNREFSPKAYNVFGPKIVATRGFFEDRALESRCITEEMGQKTLRDDIPINLTDEHKEKARILRNKLLMFRFRNLGKKKIVSSLVDRTIEPRLNQVFVPLLSVIEDENSRSDIKSIAREYHKQIITERGMEMEAQVLEVIRELNGSDAEPSIKEITRSFIDSYGEDYERRITPKWIGSIIRKKLKLKTEKRTGGFVVPLSEKGKLDRLYEKYGLIEKGVTENSPFEPPFIDK